MPMPDKLAHLSINEHGVHIVGIFKQPDLLTITRLHIAETGYHFELELTPHTCCYKHGNLRQDYDGFCLGKYQQDKPEVDQTDL